MIRHLLSAQLLKMPFFILMSVCCLWITLLYWTFSVLSPLNIKWKWTASKSSLIWLNYSCKNCPFLWISPNKILDTFWFHWSLMIFLVIVPWCHIEKKSLRILCKKAEEKDWKDYTVHSFIWYQKTPTLEYWMACFYQWLHK